MNKSNLTLKGKIQNNKLVYLTENREKLIEKFKADNEGSDFEMKLEAYDSAIHGQYKHIWGTLYPDIAHAEGERDIYKTHLKMKTRFNYINCSSADEIPQKYLRKQHSFISKHKLLDLDYIGYFIRFIQGTIIVESDGALDGYIIGLSVMSYQELDEYIKQLEHYLYVDLSGRLGETSSNEEAKASKLSAMGVEVKGGKSFDEQSEIDW